MAYYVGNIENRVWTARDERELKADHKRATKATERHLSELRAARGHHLPPPLQLEDRSFVDKILGRGKPSKSPKVKTPRTPKTPKLPSLKVPEVTWDNETRWWSRSRSRGRPGSTRRSPATATGPGFQRGPPRSKSEVRGRQVSRPIASAPPAVPLRHDLAPPPTAPLQSRRGRGSQETVKARQQALYRLEHKGHRPYVVEKEGVSPIVLKPGTWMPGQINRAYSDKDLSSSSSTSHSHGESTPPLRVHRKHDRMPTPEILEKFPLPPSVNDWKQQGPKSPNRSIPPPKPVPVRPLPALPVKPSSPTPVQPAPPARVDVGTTQGRKKDPLPPVPTTPKPYVRPANVRSYNVYRQ